MKRLPMKNKTSTAIAALALTLSLSMLAACSSSTVSQETATKTEIKPLEADKDSKPVTVPDSAETKLVPPPVELPAPGPAPAPEQKAEEPKENAVSPMPPAGLGGGAGKSTASSVTYNAAGSGTSRSAASGDRKAYSWYYMKQPKGNVPGFPNEIKQYTDHTKALWVGTGKKVYLTIDTGGPMGDTELLINSLKDNQAKANFFIAGYNVKKDPEFVRRLVADGHLVANHTMTHTDMNLQTDEQIKQEIYDYEKLYKQVTGKEIQPFFRFPYGRYNMHIMDMVSEMGYTSVFWSTSMVDWLPRKHGADDPYNDIMGNLHDGNIILMHQGSPENIEALDRIIKGVRSAGYEFALLTDIQPPN